MAASSSTEGTQRPGRARARSICIVAFLAAAAALAGYFQIVTTHTDYDDEGYVMLSLASFMDGMPLYDETYTQYGPAPFLALGAFHRVTGLPVSHDVTRLGTLVLWVGISLLASVLVWRLTEHVWLCALAFVLTFLHLERLCLEPGHPQSLCTLGTIALLVLATWWREKRPARMATIGMGVVVACILMAKSNVGVLLLASTILTWSLARASNGGSRAWLAVSGAIVLFPFALTWSSIRAVGPVLPALVAFSTLGSVMVAARAGRTPALPLATARELGGALVATTATWILLLLWSGTSPRGAWDGLVGQHLGFAQSFPVAPPLSVVAIPWAVLGTLLALAANRSTAARTVARLVILAAVAAVCVRHLVETFTPLAHGLDDRGATVALLAIVTPFVWVLLVPEADGRSRHESPPANLARVFLCMTACLQPMLAHPVPGTQMAVGTTMLLLGCLVVLHDLANVRPTTRWAIAGLVATAVLTVVVRDVSFMSRWCSLTRLRLPGSRLLRMERDQAARYRWLARTLRTRTDTFVFAEHARDSFYFWTRLPPPTALNPTNWPRMLTVPQQHRVIATIGRARRVGVVHETPIGPLPAGSPLLAYLDEHFQPGVTDGWFRVWFRKAAAGD